jgi:ribose transport system substrate-binding protein
VATQAVAAAAVTALGGKAGTIGHIAVPTFPIYKNTIDPKFDAAVKGYCADCKVKKYDMPVTALGKDSAARIVNFLRPNKEIKVLVHDQDVTALGLGPALKGGSITGVQNVGIYATSANVPNIQDGTEMAVLPDPYDEMGYLCADALARVFTGESPQPSIDATAPAVLWTKDNLPPLVDNQFAPVKSDFEQVFLTAWGK